jgi:hypothetical protein
MANGPHRHAYLSEVRSGNDLIWSADDFATVSEDGTVNKMAAISQSRQDYARLSRETTYGARRGEVAAVGS